MTSNIQFQKLPILDFQKLCFDVVKLVTNGVSGKFIGTLFLVSKKRFDQFKTNNKFRETIAVLELLAVSLEQNTHIPWISFYDLGR